MTPQQFQECLRPAAAQEQEEQQEGGMEHSIEVKYEASHSDDVPWLKEGEEWFWVWV